MYQPCSTPKTTISQYPIHDNLEKDGRNIQGRSKADVKEYRKMIDKSKLKIAIADFDVETNILQKYSDKLQEQRSIYSNQDKIVQYKRQTIRDIIGRKQGEELTDGELELLRQLL